MNSQPISEAQQRAETPELAILLDKVAAGDRTAFQQLYSATSLKLYGVVLRILRTGSRAEDAMQEIYLKIWERAGQYDPAKGAPLAWLTVLARNHALDEVRRAGHPLQMTDLLTDEIAAPQADPLAGREAADAARRLAACMETLESGKRDMVQLAYQYGLSRDELAQRFGHPVSTIKTWLRRSLESLKGCLSA